MDKMKRIIWSVDGDLAFGKTTEFPNHDRFVKAIQEQFPGKKVLIDKVRIEPCISTTEAIAEEILTPLSNTDIVIENYWLADIYEDN
jgi:hypothetical protein